MCKESFLASASSRSRSLSSEEANGYKSPPRISLRFSVYELAALRTELSRAPRTIAKKLETTARMLRSNGRKIARLRKANGADPEAN